MAGERNPIAHDDRSALDQIRERTIENRRVAAAECLAAQFFTRQTLRQRLRAMMLAEGGNDRRLQPPQYLGMHQTLAGNRRLLRIHECLH